ncbi:polyphenol oxidase family protein [Candidatus Dependentiae bacterium]|nr:polyphenol oxidase family protein [Candidatus Dependentiae bacterium]
MHTFSVDKAHIVFGDATAAIRPREHRGTIISPDALLGSLPHRPQQLVVQHQVHGTAGLIVDAITIAQYQSALTHESDFLVTAVRQIGIAVLTADCTPIVVIDPEKNVVGIAHAGWKGSVAAIAIQMVRTMEQLYGCNKNSLQIVFGPAGRFCCYQVQPDFIENLHSFANAAQAIQYRNNNIYFDAVTFNCLLLQEYGIANNQLITKYADCTICNPLYCSHRRSAAAPDRQMSIVWLY